MNTQNIRFHAPLKISVYLPSLIFKVSLLSFYNILSQTQPLIAVDTLLSMLLQWRLVKHADPIPSHQAAWFFPLGGARHGPLPRATHPAATSHGLWRASSPLKSVAVSSLHAYRIVWGFLSGYKTSLMHTTPASPIFSRLLSAFCSTTLATNPSFLLVHQPSGCLWQ